MPWGSHYKHATATSASSSYTPKSPAVLSTVCTQQEVCRHYIPALYLWVWKHRQPNNINLPRGVMLSLMPTAEIGLNSFVLFITFKYEDCWLPGGKKQFSKSIHWNYSQSQLTNFLLIQENTLLCFDKGGKRCWVGNKCVNGLLSSCLP